MEGSSTLTGDHGAIRAGRAFGQYGEFGKEGRQMRKALPQGWWYPKPLRHVTGRLWAAAWRRGRGRSRWDKRLHYAKL